MSLLIKIKRNLFFISFLSLIDRIASFILVVLIARYLGAKAYGLYAFAFAIANIAAIFTDLGINSLLTRDLSADYKNPKSAISTALGIKIPATLLTICVLFILVKIASSSNEKSWVILLMTCAHLLRVLSTTFSTIFRARLQMKYEAYAGILNRLTAVVIGATALFLGFGLIAVLWIFVLAGIVELIYSALIAKHRFTDFGIIFNWMQFKEMIFSAMPFVLLISLPVLNYRFDSILLGLLDGNEANGIYNAAYALILNFIIVQQVVGRVLLPVFSGFSVERKSDFEQYYKQAIKLLLVLAFMAILAVSSFGDEIILLIYGPDFIQSVACLKILIFALLFMFSSHVLATVLISIKKEKQVVKSWCVTVFLNVVLNVILIPQYSYIGASVATVLSELTLFLVVYYHLVLSNRYSLFRLGEWLRLALPFAAGICFLLVTNELTILLEAPLLLIVYCSFLMLAKTFSREEVSRLAKLILP